MENEESNGSIVITCKEGEQVVIGESKLTLMKVGGHKVGKAIKLHIVAPKKIPVYRIRKAKSEDDVV